MIFPTKIVLASHNQGKLKEFQKLFEPYDVKLISAASLSLPEPEETEDSFIGNALLKARHACEITAMPCLADDSGLCVNALSGQPGINSARWAINESGEKDYAYAFDKIQKALNDIDDMTAQFTAVHALVMPDGREFTGTGEIKGHLNFPPRGDKGFGYDPIFIPEGETQTFGELGAEGKDKHSHRRRAFDAIVNALKEN
jgi:XTP/dITP diphosphohydrolase